MHVEHDDIIPISQAHRLMDELNSEKELIVALDAVGLHCRCGNISYAAAEKFHWLGRLKKEEEEVKQS
ncbi:MAG: hypothetical protein AAF633_07990 [Chloroflexota bacterium]